MRRHLGSATYTRLVLVMGCEDCPLGGLGVVRVPGVVDILITHLRTLHATRYVYVTFAPPAPPSPVQQQPQPMMMVNGQMMAVQQQPQQMMMVNGQMMAVQQQPQQMAHTSVVVVGAGGSGASDNEAESCARTMFIIGFFVTLVSW